MRELFIEELQEVKGGRAETGVRCPQRTTLACCEERPQCDPCCAFE